MHVGVMMKKITLNTKLNIGHKKEILDLTDKMLTSEQ
jgi:hypothetical protein